MDLFQRREFLRRSAILSAAVTAGSPLVASAAKDEKKAGANDKLRVAVVGVNGRGMSHVGGFANKAGTEVVTICDCDEAVIGKAMTSITKSQGKAPQYVKDIRKVLDDKNIDIISIATPNHWHALMAVWAMRAGKDVYCEKPATHNLHEGRLMVQAARKYNRICQVGTQSRSNPGMRDSIQYIHDGKIGKVHTAYGTCYKNRPSIGDAGINGGEQKPPKTMDYDLWTGPAPLKMPKRNGKHGPVHYDWHWIWDYGNGDFGNQGVHEADKARWGLQVGLPLSVVSVGGRVGYVDDGETPNTQLNMYEYANDQKILFEVRGLKSEAYKGAGVGNIFFGDKGYVVCPSYASGIAYTPDGKKVAEFKGGGDQHHFDNFVKAVRSRKMQDLHCDVEQGHLSAALCHLGNISYRLGAETTLDKPVDAFTSSKEAIEAFGRMKKHLEDNKVALDKAVGHVGLKLTLDPKAETITGNKTANDMLFREYRKGFDITEAV
ncbi:Gfo/Idh/MocA family oxidoreductase [soil metagenome]